MPLLSAYRVRHKECHGEIIKRTCLRCKKHWSLLEHWTTMDYYSQKANNLKEKRKGISSKPLTGNPVTDALPAWPRWARITSTAGILLIITGVILYVF